MSGIYIHIPFCRSKCSYCDFYSIANKSGIDDFLQALYIEIEIKKKYLRKNEIDTIYFGGGTPSLLEASKIDIILNKIYKNFNISQKPEITFEANPDDLNSDYLKELKKMGINRLSIGIQSLNKDLLKLMRRKHSPEIAVNSIMLSKEVGFDNISADLIYGIDGLDLKEWENNLTRILKLPITHLSAYHLGIEKKTLLYRNLIEGKINIIDENLSFEQYNSLIETCKLFGFEQYEISNFAKENLISKHNSSYWNGSEYLGLGPSAHSYYNNSRTWNINDLKKYVAYIKSGESFYELEKLNTIERLNEKILLELRTKKGLNLYEVEINFGSKTLQDLKKALSLINTDFYEIYDNQVKLTTKGMFISDNIIERLFL